MASIAKRLIQAEAKAATRHAAEAKKARRPDVALPAKAYAAGLKAVARRMK